MATTKFFTWTKGDRKTTMTDILPSGGMVPIPAECISIKGVDYNNNPRVKHRIYSSQVETDRRQTSKRSSRRPIPLSFEAPSDTQSNRSTRTTESLALQDAAVQSATTLMTVMNDMLRSPHLSAHWTSKQHATSAPLHSRPRSHTAPSTPVAEAPSVLPAELPGSSPSWHNSHASTPLCADGKLFRSNNGIVCDPIIRPHSSPQETSSSFPCSTENSRESVPHNSNNLYPPTDPFTHARVSSSDRVSKPHPPTTLSSREGSIMTPRTGDTISRTRPGPNALQDWLTTSPSVSSTHPKSTVGSSYSVNLPNTPGYGSFLDETSQGIDSEIALMEQIGSMRAGHEAHLQSLREAHAREIASHRSYVSFLEKRRGILQPHPAASRHDLFIDTSQAVSKGVSVLTSEPSANGSLQSLDSSLETPRKLQSDAAADIEALKRKLSLSLKAQTEFGDVRRERDHLRDNSERSDRRIIQLKDIIRKTKENDKALRNAVLSLQERLVAANNERADVLEGYHEACEQIRMLADRERDLVKERDDLCSRLLCADPAYVKSNATPDTNAAVPELYELDTKRATLRSDPLLQQLDELRKMVGERDSTIRKLESENITQMQSAISRKDSGIAHGSDTTAELRQQLDNCKRKLARAEVDRDRYNTVLHSELRRQTRYAAQKSHMTTPQVGAEASAAVAERLKSLGESTTTGLDCPLESETSRQALEKELRHCLEEIIMYKLDVRGYKKDLRQAYAKIDRLQATSISGPVSPEIRGRQGAETQQRLQDVISQDIAQSGSRTPGLGISLDSTSKSSDGSIEAATVAALLSASSSLQSAVAPSAPSSQPRTPLSLHKRLPKPPSMSRTPSPFRPHTPVSMNINRSETMRSLSESIISSYAQRSTPEKNCAEKTPSRVRNSEPSGLASANLIASTLLTPSSSRLGA